MDSIENFQNALLIEMKMSMTQLHNEYLDEKERLAKTLVSQRSLAEHLSNDAFFIMRADHAAQIAAKAEIFLNDEDSKSAVEKHNELKRQLIEELLTIMNFSHAQTSATALEREARYAAIKRVIQEIASAYQSYKKRISEIKLS